jgi:hypothetical protein
MIRTRPACLADFRGLTLRPLDAHLAPLLRGPGLAALLTQGRAIAAVDAADGLLWLGGVLPVADEAAPRRASTVVEAWVLASPAIERIPVAFARTCRRLLLHGAAALGARRIRAHLPTGALDLAPWARVLGLTPRGRCGLDDRSGRVYLHVEREV